MKRIAVFCGSQSGARPEYAAAAGLLGQTLAAEKIGLVYGGAHVGLMGILADATLAAGGEVIGVIPRSLMTRELAHSGLTELHVVETMHARKALMAERADAFIAIPGGMGTLDELCEIITWAQIGLHAKPCGLLEVAGYFAPFLTFVDHMVTEGFLRKERRTYLVTETTPKALVEKLRYSSRCD